METNLKSYIKGALWGVGSVSFLAGFAAARALTYYFEKRSTFSWMSQLATLMMFIFVAVSQSRKSLDRDLPNIVDAELARRSSSSKV